MRFANTAGVVAAGALMAGLLASPAARAQSPASSGPTGFLFDQGAPLAPVGQTLADYGVYVKGFFTDILYGVPSGGLQNTTVLYNEAFYGLDIDLNKAVGIPGAVFHVSLDSRWGGLDQGVNNLTGFSEGFLAGSGPDNNTRLTEFSYDQHLFNDKLRFVFGRTQLASYFATSDLYCQFISSICSNMVPLNWSSNSNAPFFPIATWAGELAVYPTPDTYVRVGASLSDPTQYPHAGMPWDGGWGVRGPSGVYTPIEIGYVTHPGETHYPGHYDVGFYHDSSQFADPQYNTTGGKLALVGGTPLMHDGQSGFYFQAQQTLWKPDPAGSRDVWGFVGGMFAASPYSFVQSYWEAGLVAHGPFGFRPNDNAGILYTHYTFNGRQTGSVNDRFTAEGIAANVSNDSDLVEINYGFAIAPGISFKPFVDLTFHPDQNIFDIPNPRQGVNFALGTGGQLFILLNPALGLPSFFREN